MGASEEQGGSWLLFKGLGFWGLGFRVRVPLHGLGFGGSGMRVQEKAGFLYGVIYGLLKEGFGGFLDQQKGMRLGSLDPVSQSHKWQRASLLQELKEVLTDDLDWVLR